MKERTIFLHGMSKAWAMTGFRIGYACAPAEISENMMKLHQYAIMSAPTTGQRAAAEAVIASEESYLMLIRSRQLPVKYLVSEFGIPRKLIERYRKYIIAVAVIHAGDYPALQEYIHLGRGERT